MINKKNWCKFALYFMFLSMGFNQWTSYWISAEIAIKEGLQLISKEQKKQLLSSLDPREESSKILRKLINNRDLYIKSHKNSFYSQEGRKIAFLCKNKDYQDDINEDNLELSPLSDKIQIYHDVVYKNGLFLHELSFDNRENSQMELNEVRPYNLPDSLSILNLPLAIEAQKENNLVRRNRQKKSSEVYFILSGNNKNESTLQFEKLCSNSDISLDATATKITIEELKTLGVEIANLNDFYDYKDKVMYASNDIENHIISIGVVRKRDKLLLNKNYESEFAHKNAQLSSQDEEKNQSVLLPKENSNNKALELSNSIDGQNQIIKEENLSIASKKSQPANKDHSSDKGLYVFSILLMVVIITGTVKLKFFPSSHKLESEQSINEIDNNEKKNENEEMNDDELNNHNAEMNDDELNNHNAEVNDYKLKNHNAEVNNHKQRNVNEETNERQI